MSALAKHTQFSNLQLTLLELYARDVKEEDLQNINHLIGQYFMDKLSQEASAIASQKGWNEQSYHDMLNDPNQ